MNNILHKIIKQAVDYEIEKDEKLYQKLQRMRKNGGTAAMKEYWKVFNYRFEGYYQVINNEISYQLNLKMKDRLFIISIISLIMNVLMFSGICYYLWLYIYK
tara:strand:+ start:458 stop:763 length:306 start_codon:yes stop_codon:yes gene_type:complete